LFAFDLIKDKIVEGWKLKWWLGADSTAAEFCVVVGDYKI
jgi:hypothetical protein